MVINQEKLSQLKAKQSLQFDEIFYLLEAGEKVCRTGWKEIKYIVAQRPDENSKMKRPYLYAVPLDNQAVPYTLSNLDLFMSDWQAFKEA